MNDRPSHPTNKTNLVHKLELQVFGSLGLESRVTLTPIDWQILTKANNRFRETVFFKTRSPRIFRRNASISVAEPARRGSLAPGLKWVGPDRENHGESRSAERVGSFREAGETS